MDRYQRVEKPRAEPSAINENEIRITTQGLIRNYITYATTLLQERMMREIVFKAMGQAISKAVAVAEIVKKQIPGLHQDTTISSTSITDVWEPIEEGLVPLELTRHVSMISISLSTRELNKNSPGYQAPLHVVLPKMQRQYNQQPLQYQAKPGSGPIVDEYGQGRGRGRGRGRARGGWGGRGGYGGGGYGGGGGSGYGGGYDGGYGGGYDSGYGNGYGNNQENGGWNYNNNWNRGGGRGGRGWGYRGAPQYERGRGGYERGGRGYNRGGGGGYEHNRGGGGGYEHNRGGGGGYERGRGRMGNRGRGMQQGGY